MESGYSYSLTTFSPSGKLLQLEHALKAVTSGKTSLGIQGTYDFPFETLFLFSRKKRPPPQFYFDSRDCLLSLTHYFL
jgi:hypothetical protein